MSGTSAQALHRSGDPYPVLLGKGLLKEAGPRLRRLWGPRRIAVITQRKLDRLFGQKLRASLSRSGLDTVFLFMPEGERFKNLDTVQRLYDALLRHDIGREDGLLALGGGVVGDTAGFVAATFLRGVDYVQLPTTLLAQIDSSLGAKVGVNLARGKNLVGSIYRPAAVWMDPCCSRLSRRGSFAPGFSRCSSMVFSVHHPCFERWNALLLLSNQEPEPWNVRLRARRA